MSLFCAQMLDLIEAQLVLSANPLFYPKSKSLLSPRKLMTMIQILAQDLLLANGPTIPKPVRADLTSVLYILTVFEPVSQPDT